MRAIWSVCCAAIRWTHDCASPVRWPPPNAGWLAHVSLRRRAQAWILESLERGVFAPVIDRVFTLDQIVQAHAYMDANQANGKLVVTVTSEALT